MRKLPLITIVSLPMSMLVEWKYLFQDWEFAKWIGVAVVVDTVLGVWKHLIHKDANSETFFARFGKKIAVYIMLMILSNVAENCKVAGESVGAMRYVGTYLCVFMLVREVFSCVENIQAIYPILPKSFVQRLKDFNDDGDYIGENDKNKK